ncbi:MAG: NAD(P)/FAD-dependent oxidoreductase, partial [Candidatus Omnitrophota bacterium]
MNVKRIIVVGGGPAGMMAAIRAGGLGQDVTLIEKNAVPGKKLLLSGKGRCNLTNACDLDSFLLRFSHNGPFLRDAFKKFFNQGLMEFFEKRGLKLKIERQRRVFPVTDRSDSILKVLEKELHRLRIKIHTKACMKDILLHSNVVKGLFLEGGKLIPADRIILATGGVSYGFTGSTGEGIKIARRLGHSITPLRPGLVALEARQKYPVLEGLTLKNIRLSFSDGKKQIVSDIGELLFTDSGISGPLVLTLSGQIADWLSRGESVSAEIDLKPALSAEQLHARLLRDFKQGSKKAIKNTLKELLPQKLGKVFMEILSIDPRRLTAQITRSERHALVFLLKNFRLNILKTAPLEQAMVTRGGVSLKEINPRTMESRRVKGLYFCGEMIDMDADTGGFNLQAA